MICPFIMVYCTNESCDEKVTRRDLHRHVTRDCQWIRVPCLYCEDFYIWKFYQVIHVCLFENRTYTIKYYCFAIFVPGKYFQNPM